MRYSPAISPSVSGSPSVFLSSEPTLSQFLSRLLTIDSLQTKGLHLPAPPLLPLMFPVLTCLLFHMIEHSELGNYRSLAHLRYSHSIFFLGSPKIGIPQVPPPSHLSLTSVSAEV